MRISRCSVNSPWDDAICVKSSFGLGHLRPVENVTISDCYVSGFVEGTLLDGTEFDSSYKRNEPATFGVDEVIKGWTEALQLMKAGSKFMLWIPSGLAYGDQATGDKIGPNSMLTFEVELLEIKAKK